MRAEKTKEKINLFPKIAQWQKAKILILGFGREGKDSFLFLRKLFPEKKIAIADEKEFSTLFSNQAGNSQFFKIIKKDKNIKLHLGKDYLKAVGDYDLIIKSPGIPPKLIAPFITKKQTITSQTKIFFENCPGKIIGVTGSKGKSTTCALIYKILKEGLKVHPVKFASQSFDRVNLVGNIGKPALGVLFSVIQKDIYPVRDRKERKKTQREQISNGVYVYELSSHQLAGLKKSPHIAVFLNVYPDHLDYYKNFKEYVRAKANITLYQTKNDYFVYNAQNKFIKEIAKKSKAQKIPIPTKVQISTKIRIPLVSKVYLEDINAAIIVGKIFGILDKDIETAIKNFKPLWHRLELVGTFKGITFYNDALATIPEATMAAIRALGDRVGTIILGGSDKNVDFKELGQEVFQSKIKNIILFPTTGEKIWQSVQWARERDIVRQSKGKRGNREKKEEIKTFNYFFIDPKDKSKSLRGKKAMKEAVALAYKHTLKGKICLLSTACASFSLFKDYKEKGNLFKKYVRLFGKKNKKEAEN